MLSKIKHELNRKVRIWNELCECGHLKTEHWSSGPFPGMEGHGECMKEECDCKQFTWKKFLYQEV